MAKDMFRGMQKIELLSRFGKSKNLTSEEHILLEEIIFEIASDALAIDINEE